MWNRRTTVMGAAALCVLLAGVVRANGVSRGTVTLKHKDVNPRRTGEVYLDNNGYGNVYVGQYNLYLKTSVGTHSDEGTLLVDSFLGSDDDYGDPLQVVAPSWCSDVVQVAPTDGWRLYDVYLPQDAPIGGDNVPGGMTNDQAILLSKLFSEYIDDVGGSNNNAAAFEAAIWEIIYETPGGTLDVTADRLRVVPTSGGSGWTSTANIWLNSLSGVEYVDIGLRVLVNEHRQDYALTIPGAPGNNVPEPLTMLAVGLSVTGLGAYVRRRLATA